MKGPFERLKYDLRRQWECPVCHRKERSSYTQTFVFCTCKRENGDPVPMQLVDDGVRRVWGEPPRKREPIAEETTPPPATVVVPEINAEPVPFPSNDVPPETQEGTDH